MLMVQKSGVHQLRLVVYPIILQGLMTIPSAYQQYPDLKGIIVLEPTHPRGDSSEGDVPEDLHWTADGRKLIFIDARPLVSRCHATVKWRRRPWRSSFSGLTWRIIPVI